MTRQLPGLGYSISFVAAMNDDKASKLGWVAKLSECSDCIQDKQIPTFDRFQVWKEIVAVASDIAPHASETKQSRPASGIPQIPNDSDNILSNFASPT